MQKSGMLSITKQAGDRKMKIRMIFDDMDYCYAFREAVVSTGRNIFVEIGNKGKAKRLNEDT